MWRAGTAADGVLPRAKRVFENGAAAFQAKGRCDQQAEEERIEFLEKKFQRKDEILARVDGGVCRIKKRTWGTLNGSGVEQ